MLTRRQFFARIRKLGFSKSRLQMTRIGLTYEKELSEGGRVMLTVPKYHEGTFHILGDTPYRGIFIEAQEGFNPSWGNTISPASLGMENMLEVCLGILSGEVVMTEREGELS